MLSNYYIRLDDAHPKMDLQSWDLIENILDKYKIKPIVAVIPNNKDISLNYSSEDKYFWSKVKNWQKKGWHIGLHGETHELRQSEYGIMPINKFSEFVGLSYEDQKEKLSRAVNIFYDNNIHPDIFIAPAHGFDLNTIKAIQNSTNIDYISDGFFLEPFNINGINLLPQQMWTFRKMLLGTWSFCLHPSSMNSKAINSLEKFIIENKSHFSPSFKNIKPVNSIFNKLFNRVYRLLFWIKKCI